MLISFNQFDFINQLNNDINIYYDVNMIHEYVHLVMQLSTSVCPRSIKANIETVVTDKFVDILLKN